MKIWSIVGGDADQRSELVRALVPEFRELGLSVSTITASPESFDVDQDGKDSYRHRQAGATEVILASRNRWALMHENRGGDPVSLEVLVGHLAPVDVVLVDGIADAVSNSVVLDVDHEGQKLVRAGDGVFFATEPGRIAAAMLQTTHA